MEVFEQQSDEYKASILSDKSKTPPSRRAPPACGTSTPTRCSASTTSVSRPRPRRSSRRRASPPRTSPRLRPKLSLFPPERERDTYARLRGAEDDFLSS